MPVPRVTVTPEVGVEEEACPQCGLPSRLIRLYVESDDAAGSSQWLCANCLLHPATHRVEMELPAVADASRAPSRKLRRASKRQELSVAEALHGVRQKASGACIGNKGDVRVPDVLRGEMKCTTKKSFILHKEVLDKIRSECVGREKPFVHVRFLHPIYETVEDEWVCIPAENWEHLNAASNNR